MTSKPTPPGYWMNETGGELAPAVHRYLYGEELTEWDIKLLRLYLQQWIGSQVWDTNPRMDDAGRKQLAMLREAAARFLNDRKAIEAWIEIAADFGVDPL